MAFKEPEITEWEHNHPLSAKRVTNVGSDLQTQCDSTSGNLDYLGKGARGLLTSQDGWLITKFTWDSNGFPTSTTAIGIWDNRSSLTYS